MQKRNKKGFTLAELLIVVAIIAVLVAIAVPLFVGALDNAQDQTFAANKRSLKSVAITQILSDKTLDYSTDIPTAGVYAEAKVDDDGTIGTIAFSTNGDSGKSETKDYATWKSTTNGNKIKVLITKSDVSTATGLHTGS